MVSSASSARFATLLAYSLLYFGAPVSAQDAPAPVPDTSSSCVNEGWEAYDPRQPVPEPGIPSPLPVLDFAVALDYSGNAVGAGPAVKGSFMGLSISLPFVEALIGRNASWMRPQFLNLMSTLHERGGPPVLRVGGNSQEKAYIVDSLEDGRHSTHCDSAGSTYSPSLLYTKDIFVALRTASDLIGISWILGLPMNQTEPARLQVAEVAEPALGEYLLSWQLGNEPDLYIQGGLRPEGYDETMYMAEYASVIAQMNANPNIQKRPILGGPSLCECGTGWSNTDLIDNQGWLTRFRDNINMLNVMHYPTDNCGAAGAPVADTDARTIQMFDEFSHHDGNGRSVKTFAARYTHMAELSAANNLPLVLLETNTASCNGFLGLSDSFLATLWTLDLGLQLSATGFTNMMLHLGGQHAYYNAFMAPPWNATAPAQWTVMAQFYALLVSSEALGPSGNARVVDMGINGNHTQMVGYTIFENNQPVRLVLMNFMSDSGAGTLAYTANVAAKDVSRVRVRYLTAGKLTDKFGITYAGQGFGGYFESDGLLKGEQKTEEVACNAGTCAIKVPAPGVAVVFLTDDLIFDASAGDVVTTYGSDASHATTTSGGSSSNPSSPSDSGARRWSMGSEGSGVAALWSVGSVVSACVVGAWAILA